MSEPSSTAVVVPPEAAGERLDRFLARRVGSRAAAERVVAAGVLVDGERRTKSYRLEGGETLELVAAEAGQDAVEPGAAPAQAPPRIVYRDEYLLVVDKPAGLVVHPGAGHTGDTLVDLLRGELGGGDADRPGIVHRLDKNTSGLLVVARSEEAHRRLTNLVRRRALERRYLALVAGRPRSRAGRIEAPVGRDRDDPTRISLATDTPRPAVTHFELERLFERHALLGVCLETGRMHQIRVHLAAIGLPVVGDPLYGGLDRDLGRQFLHATRLVFPHPFTGERVEADSPLPPELQAYLDLLADPIP